MFLQKAQFLLQIQDQGHCQTSNNFCQHSITMLRSLKAKMLEKRLILDAFEIDYFLLRQSMKDFNKRES